MDKITLKAFRFLMDRLNWKYELVIKPNQNYDFELTNGFKYIVIKLDDTFQLETEFLFKKNKLYSDYDYAIVLFSDNKYYLISQYNLKNLLEKANYYNYYYKKFFVLDETIFKVTKLL